MASPCANCNHSKVDHEMVRGWCLGGYQLYETVTEDGVRQMVGVKPCECDVYYTERGENDD